VQHRFYFFDIINTKKVIQVWNDEFLNNNNFIGICDIEKNKNDVAQ